MNMHYGYPYKGPALIQHARGLSLLRFSSLNGYVSLIFRAIHALIRTCIFKKFALNAPL
jgi:hypothetical protein